MFPGDHRVPEAVALEPGGLDEPARGRPAGRVFEDAAAASGLAGCRVLRRAINAAMRARTASGPAGCARLNSASTTSQWGKLSRSEVR